MPLQHVYCIQAEGSPYAKVGCAINPKGRISSISTVVPHKLSFRHVLRFDTIEDAYEAERRILNASQRHPGEWVVLCDDLDRLFAQAAAFGGVIVTGEFRNLKRRGRGAMVPLAAEQVDLAERLHRQALGSAGPDPRRAVVLDALSQGLGAEDVLAQHDIPTDFYWAVVRNLEAAGTLRRTLGLSALQAAE